MHKACGDFEVAVHIREFRYDFAKIGTFRQLHGKETIDNSYLHFEFSGYIKKTYLPARS
jgi:hypothetical protein